MSIEKKQEQDAFEAILSSAEEIIDLARQGKMFILVDDETRENEGDLVIPADAAGVQEINFMATHGRGLICLALSENRVTDLKLDLMTQRNETRHQTAFTTSIEAREGVSTGISAPDRARTIAVAIDSKKTAADIVTPGHVFPLVARNGGVLERTGHTEAAVDIARLAGRNDSGVICEIMNDDGTMARRKDLVSFAKKHDLKIGTIADLIAYRLQNDSLVSRHHETSYLAPNGEKLKLYFYLNHADGMEHVAVVKGEISKDTPILTRVHPLSVLSDVLQAVGRMREGVLQRALEEISKAPAGVLVLIHEPILSRRESPLREKKTALSEETLERLSMQTPGGEQEILLRHYGIGAQILLDLGVGKMILLTNSQSIFAGLRGYGLEVVDRVSIAKEEKE